MKNTSKRTRNARPYLSTLLALALVFSLCAAMPITASAADQTVAIENGETISAIQTKIQNAIGSAGSSGAVTVTGSKDAGGAKLSLDIPSGVTVVWKANYSGAVDNPSVLIELSGVGTFEVAQSGSIRNNDNGFAIRNDTSKCTIAVSGGTVSAAVNTIKARGNISVSGGTVSADGGGWTIEGYGPSDTAVTVSGGSVIGGNNGDAIRAFDGIKVIISGGTVSGNGSNGVTILISGESSVTVVAARWNPRKTKLSTV